jgi:hypothetical protein
VERKVKTLHPSMKKEILENLESIPYEDQRIILDFIKVLAGRNIKGVPGRDLLVFSRTIERSDTDSMMKAIEEGCEKVDSNNRDRLFY